MSEQSGNIQHEIDQLIETCDDKRRKLHNKAKKYGIWRRHSQVASGFAALVAAFLSAGGVGELIGPTAVMISIPVLAALSGFVSLLTTVYLADTDTLFDGASQFLVLRESIEVARIGNHPVTDSALRSFKSRYADVSTKYDRFL